MKKFILFFALAVLGYGLQAQNCSANYTYAVDTNSSFLTVTFSDASSGGGVAIVSWFWDFGDGSTGNQQNEIHTYANGTYNVCLTITTADSCSSTYCDSIVVGNGQNPCAGFYVTGTVTNESALGTNDGAIDITVYGGTAPFLYNWSTGSTVQDLSGLSSGQYDLTVTDFNACSSIQSFYVYSDSSGQSYLDTLITGVIDTCVNFVADTAFASNFIWIDSTHVEITWILLGGGQTATITATYEVYQSGNYYVLLMINCGTKTLTVYGSGIYIDQYTGISEEAPSNNKMILYPNPVNDVLNISFAGTSNETNISIFNATGQLLRKINTNSQNNFAINVSDLQKGVYFIKIENGNEIITNRFIK